jgi:beta-aspartyl-peptidase (threonine type)
VALAKTVADLLCGPYYPDEVARKAMIRLRTRVDGEGGCVLVDKDGRIGWAHNSPHMAVAYRVLGMEGAKAFVQKAEEIRSTVGYLG